MSDFWGLPDPAPARDRWAHIGEAEFRSRIQRIRETLDRYEAELRGKRSPGRPPATDVDVDAAKWQDKVADEFGGA